MRTFDPSTRNGWWTGSSPRVDMSFRELLEKGQIAEFPAMQLALGAIKGRIDRITVASLGTGGSEEEVPLVEILGTPPPFRGKGLEDSPPDPGWVNSAPPCAGFVAPIRPPATAPRAPGGEGPDPR